jgi:hypothetical protein
MESQLSNIGKGETISPTVAKQKRDERLDFLRGICIAGMVVWHLLSDPSFPRWLSFPVIQVFNFVAEGFILLAGIGVGLGFLRYDASSKIWHHYLVRALKMLLLHYGIVLGLIGWFKLAHVGLPEKYAESSTELLRAIISLEFQPYLGDILSIFVFLFATVPFIFLIYKTGITGLLTVSLGLYIMAVLNPSIPTLNRSGAFHFNDWQLYFVLGIVLGIKYEPAISYARRRAFPLGLIALLVFVLAIPIRIALKSNPSFAENVPQWLLDRRSPLTFFRTAYVLAQLALVFLIVIRCWDRIKEWRAVHILVYWGRHSLFLFVASVFLDYAIKAFLSSYDVHFPANLLGLLGELICLHLLALAWGKLRFPLRGPGSQALQNEHR